jgi:hypothetical protein
MTDRRADPIMSFVTLRELAELVDAGAPVMGHLPAGYHLTVAGGYPVMHDAQQSCGFTAALVGTSAGLRQDLRATLAVCDDCFTGGQRPLDVRDLLNLCASVTLVRATFNQKLSRIEMQLAETQHAAGPGDTDGLLELSLDLMELQETLMMNSVKPLTCEVQDGWTDSAGVAPRWPVLYRHPQCAPLLLWLDQQVIGYTATFEELLDRYRSFGRLPALLSEAGIAFDPTKPTDPSGSAAAEHYLAVGEPAPLDATSWQVDYSVGPEWAPWFDEFILLYPTVAVLPGPNVTRVVRGPAALVSRIGAAGSRLAVDIGPVENTDSTETMTLFAALFDGFRCNTPLGTPAGALTAARGILGH